ncbi:DUF4440 domain-containing protein [Paractinoplanes lichenicola]|uniref:DUF4440 domain-containing protein n=1 Tax=Paractinoplanes lichenicola TaxID=2802976 RepID=A0ABS1W1K6_9ACTN|nr:DUF4440 domain-containing protein [Actinoplanes lichenicola]MBL7260627.1 DUF4440 domain-containing protein [Actinoplanes lichenicola]
MTENVRRVALGDGAAQAAAEEVAAGLAAQLQRGGDALDADAYDAWFAADIVWGSPFGATLTGFDQLNAIHRRMMSGGMGRAEGPASRFEVVAVLAPAPGVVVAQIRRRALAEGGFSEVALYVLVERDGRWWVAAAQNTAERSQRPAL